MSTYQKLFRLQGIDSKDVHLKGLTGQFTLQEIKMTMINIKNSQKFLSFTAKVYVTT